MKGPPSPLSIISFFSALVLLSCPARSQGALDFADPCIKTEGTFKSTADALRDRSASVLSDWDNRNAPPADLRTYYVDAVKAGMYKAWIDNPQSAALLNAIIAADPKFDSKKFFFDKVYPTISPEQEDQLVNALFKADYTSSLRPRLLAEQAKLDTQIAEGKTELDKSCKKDLFNTTFRVTVGNFAILVASNWAAAQNESGDLAKAVRAMSGVSLTDIQQYGIRGGPNSEFNKILGSAGNSDVGKLLTSVVDAFDPSKWKLPPLPTLPGGGGLTVPNPIPGAPPIPIFPIPVPLPIPPINFPSCCKF